METTEKSVELCSGCWGKVSNLTPEGVSSAENLK